jgi:hypothetical protein
MSEIIVGGRKRADLRRYAGKWIAAKGGVVQYGAAEPDKVFTWVAKHGKSGVVVLRVPRKDEPIKRV